MSSADPLRATLETALVEHPDDLATYMAYADHLAEQGDPRGEFIQVQLALEDASLPAAQRKKLQAREKRLLQTHQRAWLGPLAPTLLDGDPTGLSEDYYAAEQQVDYRWRRGFLDALHVYFLTRRLAQRLADCPAALLLRELR